MKQMTKNTMQCPMALEYNPTRSLTLTWSAANGLNFTDLPLRVRLRSSGVFRIWGQHAVDSGESPPRWTEPDLELMFFAGGAEYFETVEEIWSEDQRVGFRATSTHARGKATVEVRAEGESLAFELSIANPQQPGARPLPLVAAELELSGIGTGEESTFWSAHAYGGRTHNFGKLREIEAPGVSFVHGCIGLALPLVYLHDPQRERGIECEFMLDGRPKLWLRPTADGKSTLGLEWMPSRLLAPGESHDFAGELKLRAFAGEPVAQMRAWRDITATRYGLAHTPTPAWARHMNIIEYPLPNPRDFVRLDDPKCKAMLNGWKELGYNAIFMVGHNNVGLNPLSPYDYEPREEVGGIEAEQKYLQWCRELGFRIFLWITTVGVDRNSALAKEHRDWFTQRANGEYFYAWDSNPENNFVGYAPDADPLSTGWRDWLNGQARRIVERGYDGVFVDGCIPRADHHGRNSWPGQGRNAVEGQVQEIAHKLRSLDRGLITFVEDETPLLQAACEVTQGRYVAVAPHFPKADFDQGMGGGPPVVAAAPARIPPEMARDYLRVRYASLLPRVVSSDVIEGYTSEVMRPWVAQSLLCGCVPKTHNQYVECPERYEPLAECDEPSEAERESTHRLQRHAEFVQLLKLCRDEPELLRDAPVSIESVEVEGDKAVVGILRPTTDRALLAVIQFAPRPAQVRVGLTLPSDVFKAGSDDCADWPKVLWRAQELLCDSQQHFSRGFIIGAEQHLTISLEAFGYRIFELTRMAPQ